MIQHVKDSFKVTRSLNEALELAEGEFKFTRFPLKLRDFHINDDGQLSIQGNDCQVTRGGIQNLCSTLKIPDPFANRIPTDLFVHNVNRLAQYYMDVDVNAYFNSREELVDVNKHINLKDVDSSKLLSQLDPESKIRVMFENHFMKIEVVPQDALVNVGDHTLGNAILHYPTAKSITQAFLLMFTLVCTNGAILPRQLGGRRKLNLKSTNDADLLVANFMKEINSTKADIEEFKVLVESMSQEYFELKELNRIVNRFKRLLGEAEIPNLLGEHYQTWLNAKEKNKEEDEADVKVEISKYDLYYDVTYYGSNITELGRVSRRLQSFAGKLLANSIEEMED
jgi:hypothetical protein